MSVVERTGEARVVRAMRRAVVAFAWVWFLLALPVVTDAGIEGLFFCPLAGLGLLIGGVWVASTLSSPHAVERRDRLVWWSVPALGLVAVGLAATDRDLAVRVRLSEPALTEFAEAVGRGEAEAGYHGPLRRVGLMWVRSTFTDDGGGVYLVTTHQFMDRTCLVRLLGEPPSDYRSGRYTHLTGDWYAYLEKF